jgi:hypothetical protein
MIRIEITAAAYEALAASATRGLVEPHRSPQGGYYLWLTRAAVNRFKVARAPGEDYSATILRLAKQEMVTAKLA